MPHSAPKSCAVPGCPNLTYSSRCTEHQGTGKPRQDAGHYSIYSTPAWKKLSTRVRREEPVCHWCGVNPSTVADHVVEMADGGAPLDRANLVGSCNACNVAKGQRAAQRRAGVGGSKSSESR